MKFLVDNNLSYKLIQAFRGAFPESQHVRETLGVASDDKEIWLFAKENNFVILTLTKDNDFDERIQLYGCPPKVVHLVCGNRSTNYIVDLIRKNQTTIESFVESDAENCILKIF